MRRYVPVDFDMRGPHGTLKAFIADWEQRPPHIGEHVACGDPAKPEPGRAAAIVAVRDGGEVLLDLSGLALPGGLVIPEYLCADAHATYLLGRSLHADEAVAEGRDHERYLRLYAAYYEALSLTEERFHTRFTEDQLSAIASTLSHLRELPDGWQERLGLAVLQAGCLVDRFAEARRSGLLDSDAIWSYLALQPPPQRPGRHTRTFFVSGAPLACPWPTPAPLPKFSLWPDYSLHADSRRSGTPGTVADYAEPLGPGMQAVVPGWPGS